MHRIFANLAGHNICDFDGVGFVYDSDSTCCIIFTGIGIGGYDDGDGYGNSLDGFSDSSGTGFGEEDMNWRQLIFEETELILCEANA
jgi:hypothetical protein